MSNHTSTSSVHRIIVKPNEHKKYSYVDFAGLDGRIFILQFDKLSASPREVLE